MTTKTPFKVRDLRIKEKFCLDDAYVNGWSRYLDPSTLAVYVSLCRHADKEQSAFPSEKTIAEEHGICEKTVRNKIVLLKEWNIIKVERNRRKSGKWLRNTYFLLDKSQWIKPEVKITAGATTGKKFQNQRQQLPTKDSHLKVTHSNSETRPKAQSRCPLHLQDKYSELCQKYPNGHRECIEYLDSTCKEYRGGQPFVNFPKQFNFLHRMLRAGFDFEMIASAIDEMEKSNFYKGNWDFATVAGYLDRKGGMKYGNH